TLELGGKHEVNQNRREQKCAEKLAAFYSQLARFTGIVDREARRQDLSGFVLEEPKGLIERNLRRNDPLDPDRVQLLEFLQLARLGGRAKGSESGQRNQPVCGTSDIHLRQLIGRQPF